MRMSLSCLDMTSSHSQINQENSEISQINQENSEINQETVERKVTFLLPFLELFEIFLEKF